jgi:hypothetical protein
MENERLEERVGFLKRKNIEISAKRYLQDALSAMALGLFATLLMGTILDVLGAQTANLFGENAISTFLIEIAAIAKNMMIMGARYFVSTSCMGGIIGKQENMKNVAELIGKCDELLEGFSEHVVAWREQLEQLRTVRLEMNQCRLIFSRLMEERILFDTADKQLHKTTIYPLNDSQINAAMERWMVRKCESDMASFSVWDLYNILNQDLKPTKVEIPVLYPQLVRLDGELLNAAAHRFKGHFTPWGNDTGI